MGKSECPPHDWAETARYVEPGKQHATVIRQCSKCYVVWQTSE